MDNSAYYRRQCENMKKDMNDTVEELIRGYVNPLDFLDTLSIDEFIDFGMFRKTTYNDSLVDDIDDYQNRHKQGK